MEVELILKNYRCFSDTKPARIKILDGYITAFIGINNAGKSTLLKFFYEFRPLLQWLATNNLSTVLTNEISLSFPGQIVDPQELFCNINDRDITIEFRWKSDHTTLTLTVQVTRSTQQSSQTLFIGSQQVNPPGGIGLIGPNIYKFGSLTIDASHLKKSLDALSNTLYIPAFRNAINVGGDENYYDVPVGQLFIIQWREWKTGNVKKLNQAANEVTENIKRIFEFSQLEINPSPDNKTLQAFINRKSYRLSEFGSGLTQFFYVLAVAAMRNPSLILIDEPEINLHPSLQLDFLTTLASYATNGVFFATHSIGLARSSANQIYSIRRSADGQSEITEYDNTPQLSELLGELSFAGYKELGFDNILLVEGSTETKTIQQFLRLYGAKDHRIVILPLGGGQLINGSAGDQLLEIKRISENISALIDSEYTSPNAPLEVARADFRKLCQDMDIECHILERRAIENYFTDSAVKKAKGSQYRALQPYERLKDIPLQWAKADNWRIAREMTLEELNQTDLGNFLKSL